MLRPVSDSRLLTRRHGLGSIGRVGLTLYDVAVIVAMFFAIQIAGLVTNAVVGWRMLRDLGAMVGEDHRLTHTVGALVIQEAEKIRAIVREAQ